MAFTFGGGGSTFGGGGGNSGGIFGNRNTTSTFGAKPTGSACEFLQKFCF